jgi:hypothetical protein
MPCHAMPCLETGDTDPVVGMLAPDGRCKTLDSAGSGYVRSENCIVMLLEPADDTLTQCSAILRGSAVGQACSPFLVFSAFP